jgi:hypothetical protein
MLNKEAYLSGYYRQLRKLAQTSPGNLGPSPGSSPVLASANVKPPGITMPSPSEVKLPAAPSPTIPPANTTVGSPPAAAPNPAKSFDLGGMLNNVAAKGQEMAENHLSKPENLMELLNKPGGIDMVLSSPKGKEIISNLRNSPQFKGLLGGIVEDGVKDYTKNNLGWDTSKDLMTNIGSFAQKNPWLTGGIGALGLAGGYGLGSMFGLWGGGNQQQQQNNQANQPPTKGTSAYTASAYTPQALNKAAANIPLPNTSLNVRTSDLVMPRMLETPALLGTAMYSIFRGANPPPDAPEQVEIDPVDNQTNKAMRNPKMQEYLKGLVNRVYR